MDPVRFRLNPREDLSERPDFTFDLMQGLSKAAQAAADAAPELAALRQRASVVVGVRGALTDVQVTIDIVPRADVELTDEEKESAREGASRAIRETLNERMTEILQRSIDQARGRM